MPALATTFERYLSPNTGTSSGASPFSGDTSHTTRLTDCRVANMVYIQAGAVRLWVELAGAENGPPVLLLHGFPDCSQLWAHQIAALADAGYRVIAPDMHGYGRSDKPTDVKRYSLKAVVSDLCAMLDSLGIPKAVVVGHDWGAATAWRFAITAPQRVKRLVAISTGHPGAGTSAGGARQRAKWWYMFFFQYPEAEGCMMDNDWALAREFFGASCSAQTVQEYITKLSEPGALTAALSWYRANFQAALFGQTRPRAGFPIIQVPTLGVWSSGDTALTEQQMLASEQYVAPGLWQYRRLDGGHYVPRDAPTALSQVLLDFLGGAEQSVKRSKL